MSKSKSNSETVPWDETETPSAAVTEEPIGFSEFDSFGSSDGADDPEDAPIPPEKEPLIDEIASEYVGFWNLLVSKTNWEKGKVIHSWRTKLIEAGLPRRVYSDEAISQRLGNVTPQHVGRLRRVYERFGSQEPLPNLFWSHYQAALDWDDADEWLQKASVEKLSVAQTRVARWEKNGAKLIFFIHPKFKDYLGRFSTPSENIELVQFGSKPLNEIMMKCRMLVTDYSSVCWDVYYMGKPVIFYQFDYDMYMENHGSYLDMENELFGERYTELDDVIDGIERAIENGFEESERAREMRPKYFKYIDSDNSKRTYEYLRKKGY